MNNAIKIEDFPALTSKKIERVDELLREIGLDLLGTDRVQEIECRHRSGFSPYSWNKGGWQNHSYTSIDYLMGTGYSMGNGKFDSIVENIYYREIEEAYKTFLEQKKIDLDATWDDLTEKQQNDYQNFESEWFYNADGYLDICVEYQGRYLNYNKGCHTISLNIFLNATDAPYFRGSDEDIEIVLSFRDIDSKLFQKKLKKAIKELENFIGNVDLW